MQYRAFRVFFLATILLLSWTAILQARDTENHNGHQVAAKQAILRVDPAKVNTSLSVLIQQLTALSDADDIRAVIPTQFTYVVHSKTQNVTGLLTALSAHPAVVFAEPDYMLTPVGTPNDAYFSQQWDMYNTGTPGADIGATLAWSVSTGSTANVVGVVDTGVDYTHQDLAANMWTAPSAFTVSLSWGTLSCPAGSHGYNAITRTCNPADDNSHGTHVSGTIGAVGNNGVGVAGVNWTTRIMALKFMDSTGNGAVSDAIDSIEFGLQAKTFFGSAANLRVLSNSWGGSGYSQALLNEINRAGSFDILFVAAAGNSSANDDTSPTYPASYNAANMISVAATTNTDALASFSNYGPVTVQLGAPGVNILSTVPNNSYAYLSGTSMATPHVAGAAMLVLSACNLNTAALKGAILANVDADASLAGRTLTGGRLNVNKAIRSCAAAPPPPSNGTASFLKSDTTTGGTWKGVYGADGVNIINDTANYPSYVSVSTAGADSYTWAASTTDPRATQKASATDRIAACWFSGGTFSTSMTFNDGNTHQVALYLLDWDNWGGGRSQRVDILDGNGNLLDTRSVSAFSIGQYLVWNLSGQITIRFTNVNPASNAVVSALLFGTGASAPPPPTGTASFLHSDTTTSGSWKGIYGADGYNVIDDTAAYPSYVTVTPSGNSNYIWASSTSDPRATQKASSATDRIAACWFSGGTFSLAMTFNDGNTHQVALYLLDWDNWGGGRSQRVDILDGNGNLLDTRTVSGFTGGLYLVWNVSGRINVRVTNNNPGSNAAISGVFFGAGGSVSPPPSGGTASWLKTDSTTEGSWKGVYGADGYNVIDDTAAYPSYVTVTPSGNSNYVWASSTSDPRATQKASSATDRIAACWFSDTNFSLDVAFNDSNTHQVALYMLDWDVYGGGRTQRVDVLTTSGTVLDTRSVSAFSNGQYLVWNLSGHVVIRITNTNSNAVISGLFFR